MLLAANIEVFGFTHQGLLPVFAKDVLGVGAVGLGVIIAVGQSGGVVGHLVLASLGAFKRKGMLLFGAAVLFGLGLMTFSLASNILLFLAVLAVVNVCAAVADTLEKTLMQSVVVNEERGRAHGILGAEHRLRSGGIRRNRRAGERPWRATGPAHLRRYPGLR